MKEKERERRGESLRGMGCNGGVQACQSPGYCLDCLNCLPGLPGLGHQFAVSLSSFSLMGGNNSHQIWHHDRQRLERHRERAECTLTALCSTDVARGRGQELMGEDRRTGGHGRGQEDRRSWQRTGAHGRGQ